MGAGTGALTGALMHRGFQADMDIAQRVDRGFQMGEAAGYTKGLQDVAAKPDLAVKVLEEMDPEMRKKVVKAFDKNWLTRMLGG